MKTDASRIRWAWAAIAVIAFFGIVGGAGARTYPSAQSLTRAVAQDDTVIVQCVSQAQIDRMSRGDAEAVTLMASRMVFYPFSICKAIAHPAWNWTWFAWSLQVVAHEATHASGVASEAVASCAGLHLPRKLAAKYYGIPIDSARSREIGRINAGEHMVLPPAYRAICAGGGP